jgi:hypothetical protein
VDHGSKTTLANSSARPCLEKTLHTHTHTHTHTQRLVEWFKALSSSPSTTKKEKKKKRLLKKMGAGGGKGVRESDRR